MITLIVNGKKAQIQNSKFHSEFFGETAKLYEDQNLPIEVPEKYWPVAANYINFMHDRPTEITTVKKLLDCFMMNTYFSDIEYFKYLVKQLLLHWSVDYGNLSVLLDDLHTKHNEQNRYLDLAREIELYLPFHLVSDRFKVRPAFVKEWLTVKDNKTVSMDAGSTVVNTIINYYLDESKNIRDDEGELIDDVDKLPIINYPWSITVTFTVNNQLDLYKIAYLFHTDFRLKQEMPYLDRGADGQYIEGLDRYWYDDGSLNSETNYSDGREQGEVKRWFKNGQLHSNVYYEDGEPDGYYEEFAEDGTPTILGNYDRGRRQGEWYEYIPESGIYDYSEYSNGERRGLYERFADNGTLLESGNFLHGVVEGQWYYYNINTKLAYKRFYDRNFMVSEGPTQPRTTSIANHRKKLQA